MKKLIEIENLILKKTELEQLSQAEQRRYEEIVTIQRLLSEGYAPVKIKEVLHTTYSRIRRYATGSPYQLCSFKHGKNEPEANLYKDEIIDLLNQNFHFNKAFEKIKEIGYQGKLTAFKDYCRRLITELNIPHTPKRNTAGVPISLKDAKSKFHYVSATDVFQYIWSDKELAISDIVYIINKYPRVLDILESVRDFRNVFIEKSALLLKQFIDKYSAGDIKSIKAFASGLLMDYDAVMNSVSSALSNGFVEGNNNKIKAIKRTMYGRAKIDLLRVKVIHSR